jgi:hypothetical protein
MLRGFYKMGCEDLQSFWIFLIENELLLVFFQNFGMKKAVERYNKTLYMNSRKWSRPNSKIRILPPHGNNRKAITDCILAI